MTETPASPPPVTATVTAPHPVERDPTLLAGIAHEVAWDLDKMENILQKYGLTPDEYALRIQPNEFYQRILNKAIDEWNKADSTEKRLQMKARVALELNMHHVVNRMRDAKEPLSNVVQAGKLIAEIGGLAGINKAPPTGSGERVVINIDLGGEKLRIDKSADPKIVEARAGPSLQSLPEGESQNDEVRQITQGAAKTASREDQH